MDTCKKSDWSLEAVSLAKEVIRLVEYGRIDENNPKNRPVIESARRVIKRYIEEKKGLII